MAPGNQPTPPGSDPDDTADSVDTEDAKEARLEQALGTIPRDPSTPLNLKAIAREHNVSYDTLRRRHLKETKPKKVSHVHLQRLTPAEEEKVVDWATFLSIQGRPVDKDMLTPKLVQLSSGKSTLKTDALPCASIAQNRIKLFVHSRCACIE